MKHEALKRFRARLAADPVMSSTVRHHWGRVSDTAKSTSLEEALDEDSVKYISSAPPKPAIKESAKAKQVSLRNSRTNATQRRKPSLMMARACPS